MSPLIFLVAWALILACVTPGTVAQIRASRPAPFRLAVQLHSMDECKATKHFIAVDNFTSFRAKSGVTFLSTDIKNLKLLKSLSKVDLRHTSCTDVESYNTCQYGGTYSFSTGLCVLMMSDAVPWSAFMKSIEPRFQCPCVAGEYKMKNATINMAALEKMMTSGFRDMLLGRIHVIEARVFNENKELHACVVVKMSFLRTRS